MPVPPAIPPAPAPSRPLWGGTRGFLNPAAVRGFAFFVITLCLLASVVVSIMAVWNPAQTDVLLKTLATCLIVAAGSGLFTAVNTSFGPPVDRR